MQSAPHDVLLAAGPQVPLTVPGAPLPSQTWQLSIPAMPPPPHAVLQQTEKAPLEVGTQKPL
jgi:hypothetical protein